MLPRVNYKTLRPTCISIPFNSGIKGITLYWMRINVPNLDLLSVKYIYPSINLSVPWFLLTEISFTLISVSLALPIFNSLVLIFLISPLLLSKDII